MYYIKITPVIIKNCSASGGGAAAPRPPAYKYFVPSYATERWLKSDNLYIKVHGACWFMEEDGWSAQNYLYLTWKLLTLTIIKQLYDTKISYMKNHVPKVCNAIVIQCTLPEYDPDVVVCTVTPEVTLVVDDIWEMYPMHSSVVENPSQVCKSCESWNVWYFEYLFAK